MKTSLKNVVIGDISICTDKLEHLGNDDEIISSYRSKACEKDVVLVKDNFGSYVRFEDVEDMGSLALSLYGATTRYKSAPKSLKDKFVSNTRSLFPDASSEPCTVKDMILCVNDFKNSCDL